MKLPKLCYNCLALSQTHYYNKYFSGNGGVVMTVCMHAYCTTWLTSKCVFPISMLYLYCC